MERTHSFGYWLRRRRKALDLTQAALAQRVSCSLDLIQKLEADARRPSRQLAERLAASLGLDATEQVAFVQAARAERSVDQLALPDEPIAPPTPVARTNLPAQLTTLIGREREVAAVVALLHRADTRLLTLTGPGGGGKTRLGLQVAAELSEAFSDGVYFVDLAPTRDPSLVGGAIAQALGIHDRGSQSPLERLKDELRDKQMLLLLDNFEQLLDAAPQLAELLAATTRLKLLVTSREQLHLRGEQEVAVPPLALPDPANLPAGEQVAQVAAVALFVQRAQASQPDFALTSTNASAIATICVRLDGLPLAIELAAARIKLFAPETLLARLGSGLALLTGGPRDLPARQQTIRNTIAWSYELLSNDEQQLFRRLGVFVGGCTLEAIEAIYGAADDHECLATVTALVDKSLLRQVAQSDGATRFLILETIREYALEQLEASGEAEQLRRQHAVYFQSLGEVAYHTMLAQSKASGQSPEWGVLAQQLHPEDGNLLAALAWSQTMVGDPELALSLSNSIHTLWFHFGVRHEAIASLERSLNHPLGIKRSPAHYQARMDLAEFLGWMGNYAAAQIQYDQALLLARELGETEAHATTLERLGWLAREQGESTTAWALMTASLALFRELGNTREVAGTLVSMSEIAVLDEDPGRVDALLAESCALIQEQEADPELRLWTLNHRGHAAQLRGDYQRAVQLHRESLSYFDDNYHAAILMASHSLGESALGLGQLDEAARWLGQGLRKSQDIRAQAGMAWCLAGLGSAAALDEMPERAARLWGAAERLRLAIGCRPPPAARATYERAMAIARAQLGEQAFAAAWAAGQALPLAQAIAEASGEPGR